jgi:transcriptional regulator with XRE-family HTH domain
MKDAAAAQNDVTARSLAVSASHLGGRLRSLRLAAGLTQTQLAGERFSKEYISQIERGKTRPTAETVAWLAGRLGVDAAFLGKGVSTDERGRIEALLVRAEALTEAHRYDEAVELFTVARAGVGVTGSAELEVRSLSGEAWAHVQRGATAEAIDLLLVARDRAEGPQFSDLDRADILFRLGVCR